MLTTTVNVSFAFLTVVLMKGSCLHEYQPVISDILVEPAAPTFQAPADPEDGGSRTPLLCQNPFTHQHDITPRGT
jgi:hypothetical protein